MPAYSTPPPRRRAPPEPMAGATTTTWGVVLAVGLVAATLALNAPGGSNSIAGRAINATMVTLFPADAPAAPSSQEASNVAAGAAKGEAPAATPAAQPMPLDRVTDGEGELTESMIREGAVRARANMSHVPAAAEFRNVYAITTLGLFNGEVQDRPFLGFCGEISMPEGAGWGRPGWKPFFISETASLPAREQGPYLDMANPSTLAKCASVEPTKDYSDVFGAGETDVLPAYMRASRQPS